MRKRKKAVFNWSGGKDSALALQKTLQGNEFEVIALLTTIEKETLKSSVHGIPVAALLRQADSIGIPLHVVLLAKGLANYNEKMLEAAEHFKQKGVAHFIFGDISLGDVRKLREAKLNPSGIEVVEPLWGKSSAGIISDFFGSGIKAKIIVTRADKLDKTFIGKALDKKTISAFPEDVDVCGENGEYHTFSYAGGIFRKEVEFSILRTSKISQDIKLDNGQTKTFGYWQAEIIV